jgi:hypothetical protein
VKGTVEALNKYLGITHISTGGYNARANAVVERFMQTLNAMLRTCDDKTYKDIKDVDPADVDDVATAKDIASADKNIMIQLKKQVGLGDSFQVEFGDKKKARVPDNIAKKAIALYDEHKTSQQKGDYQKTIGKSYKALLSFIRKGKPVSMESKELKQMNPTDHVKEKDGKFCVYNADGSIAKEFDNKEDAEKYAIANHDKLMAKEEVELDVKIEGSFSDLSIDASDSEQLAFVKKLYPFVDDITDKRKKVTTVQGFFHFLKNKDRKAVDKLNKIIKKLGPKKAMKYIDSYRQNYLRMSNSQEENYIVEDNVATLKNIVKRKQAMPLKFKDGTMKIDLQTASGLVRSILGGKMKPETMKKLSQIINKGNKSQFLRLVDLMYK